MLHVIRPRSGRVTHKAQPPPPPPPPPPSHLDVVELDDVPVAEALEDADLGLEVLLQLSLQPRRRCYTAVRQKKANKGKASGAR